MSFRPTHKLGDVELEQINEENKLYVYNGQLPINTDSPYLEYFVDKSERYWAVPKGVAVRIMRRPQPGEVWESRHGARYRYLVDNKGQLVSMFGDVVWVPDRVKADESLTNYRRIVKAPFTDEYDD